jgi:hypothetical protein
MGFFSSLFKTSSFFSSEYTDKSMMLLTEVMNAHANWKSRIHKFMEGTLDYSLDPEMVAQADATELGRWILQSDALEMSAERRLVLDRLHQANVDLHQVAHMIVRDVLAGKLTDAASHEKQFVAASKRVIVLLIELGREG